MILVLAILDLLTIVFSRGDPIKSGKSFKSISFRLLDKANTSELVGWTKLIPDPIDSFTK